MAAGLAKVLWCLLVGLLIFQWGSSSTVVAQGREQLLTAQRYDALFRAGKYS
jgi:hypothetical protein